MPNVRAVMVNASLAGFLKLQLDSGRSWPAIRRAQMDAQRVTRKMSEELGRVGSTDIDLVLFGSVARGEWTSGSDIDWTLLIDGQADLSHWSILQEISDHLQTIKYRKRALVAPGSSGIFGNLTFSHELIHKIGGQDDSNKNTTQRILMLLESIPLRSLGSDNEVGAYERVVRAIIRRYVADDTNFYASDKPGRGVPRFLLNDIVRFWRTMCVDFAWKHWEQSGRKWALRNIKLRMSRKLIFTSGLLIAFSCFDNPHIGVPDESDYTAPDHPLLGHLMSFVSKPPIEVISETFCRLGVTDSAVELFDIYDDFLSRLDQEEVRRKLENLSARDAYKDRTFLELRSLSHRFQEVLTEAFFDRPTPLRVFNRHYGVF